jgi:hypothetical protein
MHRVGNRLPGDGAAKIQCRLKSGCERRSHRRGGGGGGDDGAAAARDSGSEDNRVEDDGERSGRGDRGRR